MVRDNYKEGTIIKGKNGSIKEASSATVYDPINAALSSQIRFDPNFKAYLTFFIHKNVPITNLDYFIGLNSPLNGKNGERKIIPVSHSLDLVSRLKKTDKESVLKDGPAKIKIVRCDDINNKYRGWGIENLYKEFAIDRRLDSLFYEELEGVSREQFEIAVPEENPNIIQLLNPESKFPFYLFTKYSDRYTDTKGIRPYQVVPGEKINITKEDLKDRNDKIVVGFGNIIGDIYEKDKKTGKEKPNRRRRFLIYITPNELVPKL